MRRLTIITLCILGLCSCSGSTAPDNSTAVGVWTLRSVNGHALPFNDGTGYLLVADSLSLMLGDNYHDVLRHRFPSGQEQIQSFDGVWALTAGNRIFANGSAGNTWFTDWKGDSLTDADPNGNIYVYRR